MSIEISPKSFFEQPSVADMRLISCPGAEELTGLIDKHLVRWAKAAGIDKETFIIPCDCPRQPEAPDPGSGRQGTPCVGYYAQPVRWPSASPCGARKSGLRCGPAGAADHGCAQHHHL